MRRDRKNQLVAEGLRARYHDLDPISRTPYGPAANESRIKRPDIRQYLTRLPPIRFPHPGLPTLGRPHTARTVYERLYCARGNMENTIKEQQLDLFSDRTSATCFAANRLRLLFSAFASILFDALRQALHGTRLARATARTLRLGLLKIGARVTVSVRRVKVAMDSAHPSAAAFARVHARLPG